jgi:AI-2 transport protein TqsA
LEHRAPRLPRAAALGVALAIFGVLFAASAVFIADNAGGLLSTLISSWPRMAARMVNLAGDLHLHAPGRITRTFRELDPSRYLGPVAMSVQNAVADAVLVLVYLAFLLASRRTFKRKVVTLFPRREQRERARETFERIRIGIERYVWVQTVTGAMIAVACWAVMALLGLQNALFWAFFIFVTSYVPMIGAAVGMLAPIAIALLQFPRAWPALELAMGLGAIYFLVGNLILPRMQGRSLNLDPVVLLVSLAFWGALWGLVGAFLSSPLTVMAMIILDQFPSTRWIAVLLSSDGVPGGREHHVEAARAAKVSPT